VPNLKAQGNNEFLINIKKGKKADTMKFSSDHRADILTECLRFSNLFGEKFATNKVILARNKSKNKNKCLIFLIK
jgi:DnaJ family protein C protein 13